MIFLFQAVAPPILHYIGMWIHFKFAQQFNFLPEYKLTHIVFESHLFDTFNITAIILDLVHITIAPTDNFLSFYYVFFVKISISAYEFCLLWAHLEGFGLRVWKFCYYLLL